jgi:acetyl-CoA carboxylase biotin carboxylase subunit
VQLREPSGPGVRLDSGVYPGWTVPLEYDPLLAKLITWGPDRNAAIQRLQRALGEYTITGVETNVAFFREILDDPEFRAGNISTGFVADFFERRKPRAEPAVQLDLAVALAAAAYAQPRLLTRAVQSRECVGSLWVTQGRSQLLR